jgi:hypothetical protein
VQLRSGAESSQTARADAYAALLLADQSSSLAGEDLELLATAAHLVGRIEECLWALQRAQQLHAEGGDPRRAAGNAFWLAFHLMSRGDVAQANGWLARANRLLEHEPQDCPERGYLLLPVARQQLHAGDHARGQGTAARAVEIGRRARDGDLVAFALFLQGRAKVTRLPRRTTPKVVRGLMSPRRARRWRWGLLSGPDRLPGCSRRW